MAARTVSVLGAAVYLMNALLFGFLWWRLRQYPYGQGYVFLRLTMFCLGASAATIFATRVGVEFHVLTDIQRQIINTLAWGMVSTIGFYMAFLIRER